MTILLIIFDHILWLKHVLTKIKYNLKVNPAHQLGINKHFYLKPLAAKYDFKVKQERRGGSLSLPNPTVSIPDESQGL